MSFEKKDMQGSLFFNDKGDNDKRPDLRGYVIINGIEYELAGWNGREGSKVAVSLKAKVKEERRDEKPYQPQSISQRAMPKGPSNQYAAATGKRDPISSGRMNADIDDEIPF